MSVTTSSSVPLILASVQRVLSVPILLVRLFVHAKLVTMKLTMLVSISTNVLMAKEGFKS